MLWFAEEVVHLNDDVRILVVDDNLDILSIVSRLLRETGYAVREAATGQQCLQLVQEEKPDIILLDVNLPDISGIEVCRRIKADPQLSHILVAHVSATNTSSESQVVGLEAGADAYIVQPISNRELLARVGALARLKRAEDALQAAERQYRSIFENSAEGIFRTTPEGRFLLVNPALARMLGYDSPQELMAQLTDIGRQLYVHPEQRLQIKQRLEEHGSVQDFEAQFYRKDGSVMWATVNARAVCDQHGRLLYYEGTNTDITQRKRVEQLQTVIYRIANAAHQHINMDSLYRFIHQELSGILDTQNFYIALYDAEQDLLLFPYYVDETRLDPRQTSGHSRKPRKGLTEYVLRTGQSLFAYEQDIRELVEQGEVELIGALARVWLGAPLKREDKIIGVIAVQSYTNPAAYTQKDLEFLEFIASQIGGAIERKWAEATLQETNRRLERALAELQRTQQHVIQQERLRAIGAMASGIAHDFNNALSPILGYSELLLAHPDDLRDQERVKRYLERINVAAQDAAHVVSRLREFYRHRDEGEVFLPVHVNQIVEQALSLTQPKWKNQAQAKGIAIQVQTDLRPVPTLMGNESDLREMMTNLIFNAVDAMPHGGTMTIRTRLGVWEYGSMGETTPTLPHSHTPTQVVLEVSDTGVGMSEEVRQRCLEPFFTTKGERGTGMGLAMVYGIVQRHEGTMEIESALGQGTTIIIRLPVQQERSGERGNSKMERPLPPLHVLVIEDEPVVCDIITEYLIEDGHTFEVASNGLEGLERFEINKFDLIITDRAMPEMSGDHVATAIKQMEPHVPVIMLTGFGDLMNSAGERPLGVDLIVSKPVTIAKLRQAILQVTTREKLGKT